MLKPRSKLIFNPTYLIDFKFKTLPKPSARRTRSKMDATKLIDLVRLAAEAPSEKLPQEDMARRELVTAMRKLSARLENPIDSIMRFVFQVCVSHAPSLR